MTGNTETPFQMLPNIVQLPSVEPLPLATIGDVEIGIDENPFSEFWDIDFTNGVVKFRSAVTKFNETSRISAHGTDATVNHGEVSASQTVTVVCQPQIGRGIGSRFGRSSSW